MTHPTWLNRVGRSTKLILVLLALSWLASCGSSKKYDEFMPTRILSVGDAMSYMSFTGTTADNTLTAKDPATSSTDHWLWVFAAAYGLTNKGMPNSGGNVLFFNYSHNGAPAEPDSVNKAFGTIAEVQAQVNALPLPQTGDLVVMTIGMGDIFSLADTLGNTAITDTNAAALVDIGLRYANLADSIYQRGFKHVLIVTAIDFSTSAYVAAQSPTYQSNIKELTKALNTGVNSNCYGGCTSHLDSKPYPTRAEGVWKFDAYNFLLNIALRTPSSIQFDINNGVGGAANPLCASVAPVQTCTVPSLYNASSPALPYYYASDLFVSPIVHRYLGSFLYSRTRGFAGF